MSLAEKRMEAARASRGISNGAILDMALRLLKHHCPKGRLLDYGSGVGDLLLKLRQQTDYDEIAGVDILPRPDALPESIRWFRQDLNTDFTLETAFDVVVSTEVIEHLENPRATFRNIHGLLKPGGIAVITTPNQNSLRSIAALAVGGHFAAFLGSSYPAHITALTHLDLLRIAEESHFEFLAFAYTDQGGIPKMPHIQWQKVSFGLLKGRLFSDNLAIAVRKK